MFHLNIWENRVTFFRLKTSEICITKAGIPFNGDDFRSDNFNEPTTVKTLKCEYFYENGSPLYICLFFSFLFRAKQIFTFKTLLMYSTSCHKRQYISICIYETDTQLKLTKYPSNCFRSPTTIYKYSPKPATVSAPLHIIYIYLHAKINCLHSHTPKADISKANHKTYLQLKNLQFLS